MKHLLPTLTSVCILLMAAWSATAQNTFPATGSVGIGTTEPNASSILDISSTSKGLLVPRMTKAQKDAIVSPATGLLIYQTTNNAGFYYYDGSAWSIVAPKSANRSLNNLTTPTAVNVDLLPGTDNSISLGSALFSWKNLYADGVGYFSTTKVGNYTGIAESGMIRYTGTEFQGYTGGGWTPLSGGGGGSGANISLSNLGSTAVNVSLKPGTNGTINLGDSLMGWKDLYLQGALKINDKNGLNVGSNNTIALGNIQNANVDLMGTSFLAGSLAGQLLPSGSANNLIIGFQAGGNVSSAVSNNIFLGNQAGYGTGGSYNLALGYRSGYGTSTGDNNVMMGKQSGENQDGGDNVLLGNSAGKNNTGNYNVIAGYSSGLNNTAGDNVMLGNSSGYSNQAAYSVFIGRWAGKSNTTGAENLFIGANAGNENTTGSYNTVVASQDAMLAGPFGNYNAIVGYNSNVNGGTGNSLFGALAAGNISGNYNTAIGYESAGDMTGGANNVFVGAYSGADIPVASPTNNVCVGYYSGSNLNIATGNIFVGSNAGKDAVSANNNVVIGNTAGNELNDGHANVFIGNLAGTSETNGDQNVYVGNNAGVNSSGGSYNVAVGTYAGNDITTNTENVFVGNSAGFNQGSGNNIVAIGSGAGDSFSGNQSCTFVGKDADASSGSILDAIAIGAFTTVTASNTGVIGNSSFLRLGIGGAPSGSNRLDFGMTSAKLTNGGVWTNASDERLKDQKTRLDKLEILEKIADLRIERWHYKADAPDITHIGPYAKQFYELFQTGDDSTISTIDPSGVALLGIQALHEQQALFESEMIAVQSQVTSLRKENDMLLQRLAAIESRLATAGPSQSQINGFGTYPAQHAQPSLGECIPNPASNSTSVSYVLPANTGAAELQVMDALGKALQTFPLSIHNEQVEISTRMLPAGLYQCVLFVDGQPVSTRQLAVSR